MEFDGRVFKANDIRGTYPQQITERFAFALGRATVEAMRVRRVAVGRDGRVSSPSLCAALAAGLRAAGAEVGMVDICPSELLYYVVGSSRSFDLAVMVTASHNPAQFNGFKLVGPGGEPVSERNGLGAIRERLASAAEPDVGSVPPIRKTEFPEEQYVEFALRAAGKPDGAGMKVVVDPANATGALLWDWLAPAIGIEPVRMNFELDGRFPAHEPNPAQIENLRPLRDRVMAEGADIGFAYDGDADRTAGVLADGHIVDGSEMIAALVEALFEGDRSVRCAVNLVASRKVLDHFRARGSDPVIAPVGHSKVKQVMRGDPAIAFAGEQSGHYFFREFFCCESSVITTLHLLRLAAEGRLAPLLRGLPGPWVGPEREPSFHFERLDEALTACRAAAREGLRMFPAPDEIMCEQEWHVARRCRPGDIADATGVRVDYADWWFAVRPSATEPLARLTGEARTGAELDEKLTALSRLLIALSED